MRAMDFVCLFTGLVVTAIGSSAAYACPSGYSSASCDEGGADICQMAAGHIWECDITRNGGLSGGSATAVRGLSLTYQYSAWGTDTAGNNFCCEVTNSSIDQVTLLGGSNGDTLSLQYDSGLLSYDLSAHGTTLVTGNAFGRSGNDVITGSRTISSLYRDSLQGDDGNDTISGDYGDDTIAGGNGNDTLHGDDGIDNIAGGNGNDTIDGGSGADFLFGDAGIDDIAGGNGNDTLHGGPGEDILTGDDDHDQIYGGSDVDSIAGGNGNDTLHGDDDADYVCGDGGNDSMTGDNGVDTLWDDSGTNTGNGGTGSDECAGTGSTYQDCETSARTSRPASCP